jgi:pyruvate dehydrogenase E2 component (dihydrolipoamide acetyltransferase)
MPSLGADMDAGTLVEWHVKPGAQVHRGDIVVLVETEKGLIEVEIWESGVIGEILIQPGAKVPVGTVLATLREERETKEAKVAKVAKEAKEAVSSPAVPTATPASPAIKTGTTNGSSMMTVVRASPAARQLAREHDIDLRTLHGTGPHEAVTRDDVAREITLAESTAKVSPPAQPQPPPPTPPPPSTPPTAIKAASQHAPMRKAIAAAMARSKREIPHYYLGRELDMSRAVHWLETENATRPITERVLVAALLLKAVALALREVPELNGFWIDGEFRPSTGIHVGVAIALRQGAGLVAPAIHDTDQKSLAAIMVSLGDLVTRARAGSLRSSEMSDPTITVTNLGDLGTDMVFGVIYPPQVAIIGFGTMRERPWAKDGMLGVRPIVNASLAADHRVTDGHRGARFLAAIERLLDQPEKLL